MDKKRKNNYGTKEDDKVNSLLMIRKIYATISDEAKDILEQNWQVTPNILPFQKSSNILGPRKRPIKL